MGQLRGQGDHPVVLLRGGTLHATKTQRQEKLAGPIQFVLRKILCWRQNHGSALKQIFAGEGEAAFLHARHRMPAQIEEAMPPS